MGIEQAGMAKAESGVPFEMYEVPGQDPISEKSFGRYARDKAQDAAIIDRAEHAEWVDYPLLALRGGSMDKASPAERAKFEAKLLSFVTERLADPDWEVQRVAANLIPFAATEEQPRLRAMVAENISRCVASVDPVAHRAADKMFSVLSPRQQALFTETILQKEDFDSEARVYIVRNVRNLDVESQARLRPLVSQKIREGLNSPQPGRQVEAAKMIGLLEDRQWKDRAELQRLAASAVERGLNDPDIRVQCRLASVALYTGEEIERLEEMVSRKVEEALDSPDPEVQKAGLDMISFAFPPTRKRLTDKAIQKGLGAELVKPSLYDEEPMEGGGFSRREFEKTGSRTILLGGALRGNTIIREIEPEPFLTWQELYEDYALWRGNGFDYVPIEPIQSYRLNEHGRVEVFTGVLDLSWGSWIRKTNLFRKEIDQQKQNIITVINRQTKIDHGHMDHNFCLRFFRDADGGIDFTRPPRVYLIDFDQAFYAGSPKPHESRLNREGLPQE